MTAAAAVLVCAVTLIVVTSLGIHYRDQATAECGDWDDDIELHTRRRDALRRATRTETL